MELTIIVDWIKIEDFECMIKKHKFLIKFTIKQRENTKSRIKLLIMLKKIKIRTKNYNNPCFMEKSLRKRERPCKSGGCQRNTIGLFVYYICL